MPDTKQKTSRESWVLPNEDTEFPFNSKIAELSTQEDLDTWIAAHGSEDLFRSLRYALEPHDDQIEIHNELVQMVDAAARFNELEETVVRLQRENEEGRLSRQNTPSISHEPKRSTKLPDPLIFEGQPTPKAGLEKQPDTLLLAYEPQPLNRFGTAEEIFGYMTQVYGDPDRRHTAQRAYLKLYQGKRSFTEFWAEFQRLAAELDYNQTPMIDDLPFKLNPSLQNALVHVPDPTDIYEFVRTCQRVDQRLKDIQAVQARVERRNPTTAADGKAATPQANTAKATTSTAAAKLPASAMSSNRLSIRPIHSDPERETLLRTGSCFNCKQQGHRAADWPPNGE